MAELTYKSLLESNNYLRNLSGKKSRLRSKLRDLSGLLAPADSDIGTAAEASESEVAPPEPEAAESPKA